MLVYPRDLPYQLVSQISETINSIVLWHQERRAASRLETAEEKLRLDRRRAIELTRKQLLKETGELSYPPEILTPKSSRKSFQTYSTPNSFSYEI